MIVLLSQVGAFFGWFVYGSFFEWTFHKYLFHRNIIPWTYNAHDRTHHGTYSGDDYDLPSPADPDGKHIMMDWFALPLFLAFHFPIIWGVQKLTGIPMLWGGLAAIAAYYVCYEGSHYIMHVPRDRWIEKTRVFLFLNDHHRLHHKDHNTNLNVVFPLADVLFRTLRTNKMRKALLAAQAAQSTKPAAARAQVIAKPAPESQQ